MAKQNPKDSEEDMSVLILAKKSDGEELYYIAYLRDILKRYRKVLSITACRTLAKGDYYKLSFPGSTDIVSLEFAPLI